MTKTFKTILGLILAWALVAQASVVIAQSPNITSMHTAATATGNGTALVVSGQAGNPANTIGAAGVQIANSAGTFTITFETLTSGSTWTAVMATNMTDDVRATTATAAGQYTVLLGGAVQLRARISACSGCNVTVVGRLVPGLVARVASGGGGGGSGTVTSVGWTGGIVSVATATTTPAFTIAGTSGGIPYFSSSSTWASSAALAANALVIGGGAGAAPSTTTTGTGVLTALGVNVGSAGAFVVNGGALGTPSSGTLTSATGLPISTGLTGAGTGVLTALGVNVGSAGAFVVNGGALGTPSSGTLTSATGLPISTGVSGLGTGIATALAVNVGSAGAPVLFNGAGGTPSSLTLTNATGLPVGSITGFGTGVATFLATPSSANFLSAITDETGTGLVMGNNTPTIITPSFTTGFTIGGVAATGTIPRGNGTNFVASAFTMAAPGTSGNVLTSDGTNWTSSAPAGGGITIGTTTVTGGASTDSLYNNAGVVGSRTVTGTGNDVLSASPTLTGTVAMAAQTNTGTIVQTSASATAFESGPNGGTNPVFRLVNSTASQADGLSVTGLAAASGVNLTALSSGANSRINITPKGSGVNRLVGNSNSDLLEMGAGTGPFYWNDGGSGPSLVLSKAIARVTTLLSFQTRASKPIIVTASTGMYGWGSWTNFAETADTGLVRNAAGLVRITDGQTSGTANTTAGSLLLGTDAGAIGSSGKGVLAFALSTAPTTSPTDTVQVYSNDSAAADHNLFTRNEAGEINRLTGLAARNSSAFTKTTDTTLANITGLSRNVEAGRTYAFTATMQTTAAATGGVKFAVSGTATATSISYEGVLVDSGVVIAQTRATALDTTVCASTTSTAGTCTIKGVIVVNAAGTLVMQFAQNASDGGASTVLVNQYLQLIPIS